VGNASQGPRARIIGLVYLSFFLSAVVAEFFLKGIVVRGDATATANHILANEGLFRLGIASGLVSTICYIALIALFYAFFAPVDKTISRMAAFFGLVGCSVQAIDSLFRGAPLVVVLSHENGQPLRAFNTEQLQTLGLLLVRLHTEATNVSLVFFGMYCLLIGLLVCRSGFLPRVLGGLMVIAGVGWLTFLSPPLAQALSPVVQIVGVIAELTLMLWLLVKGVRTER